MTFFRGTILGDEFEKAKPGSPEEMVFLKNMDLEESFVGFQDFSRKLQDPEYPLELAYYGLERMTLIHAASLGMKCSVTRVWKTRLPMDLLSFAIAKDSVFKPFFKRAAIKIANDGHVSHFAGRNDARESSEKGMQLSEKTRAEIFFICRV